MLSRSALVRTRWTLAFVVEHIERDRDPPREEDLESEQQSPLHGTAHALIRW